MWEQWLGDLDVAARLLCGMAAGIVVGWERTLKQSAAGIRTFGLVGLGTATAAAMFSAAHEADEASRVIQGVLTGVGFLGAGVITVVNRKAEQEPAPAASGPGSAAGGSNGDVDRRGNEAPDGAGSKPEARQKPAPSAGPSGLTTAAAVWVTAALGCTAGLGDLHLVAIGVGLALVLLLIDHSVERLAGRRASTH